MKRVRIAIAVFLVASGCGTSKWTDTGRSATEQLLISDAMDRAVSQLDLRALSERTIYLDTDPLRKVTDSDYLISCLRQHMIANGCVVKEKKEDADYIVEVRAGAVGTDHHDVLYGVPAVSIPSVVPLSGIPSQIPEMPFIKKTDQRAIVKLYLFAYNRETGRPLWQSGADPQESKAKAVWVLGAGPFQRGTIYDGTEFAGDRLDLPLIDIQKPTDNHVSVADEAYFVEPQKETAPEEKVETAIVASEPKKEDNPKPDPGKEKPSDVVPAGHSEPSAATNPSPPPSDGGNPPPEPAAAQAPPENTTSPNDLAPALSKLGTEPRLLATPSGASPPPGPPPVPLD
jgi:hypothetical protein